MPTNRPTLAQTFEQARRQHRTAVMPFIPAGVPDLATTRSLLKTLQSAGADLIEIGIPFSDPIADGPTIQEAFAHALANRVTVNEVLNTIAAARNEISLPLVAMVSYSIVYRYGPERFFTDAKAAGFDGLILPDLPPPEAQPICRLARQAGLETVLLVAPTTTPARRKEIAALCSGFVYYLSVQGITGERDHLPQDVRDQIHQLKGLTDRPVCVGFGISRPEHVQQLQGLADGAIIGSALVRAVKSGGVAAAGELCLQLVAAAKRPPDAAAG